MRKAYKPVLLAVNEKVRTTVDQTVEEFAATMHYGEARYASPEDFLQAHNGDWKMELHAALKDILDPKRTVLGIGSGECEHEIPFFLDAYDITGSDVVPEVFLQTMHLFPGLYKLLRLFDQRLCILNNATVLEFIL